MATSTKGAGAKDEDDHPWEYKLRKYLLLLVTLVATVTYSTGFSPPGGVWEDTDHAAGHLAGDPIIRASRHTRYVVFFYCNATAFVSSVVVSVLILLLGIVDHDGGKHHNTLANLMSLRVVMVMDLVSLMGAYAAGTCTDTFTAVYSSLLVAAVFAYLVVQMVLTSLQNGGGGGNEQDRATRKVLMLLATFAVSVTYVAGLSTPGGFWVDTSGGHHAGDAILKDRYDARLTAFFICNTTAFVASLLIIVLLLRAHGTLRRRELNAYIIVALAGLVGAYTAGGGRAANTTVYVLAIVGAILAFIIVFYLILHNQFCERINRNKKEKQHPTSDNENSQLKKIDLLEKGRSLVLLLAVLAATITYQGGLDPPGGHWPEDDGAGRHKAGDPILLSKDAARYAVFFYCNSVAFVASLVSILVVRIDRAVKYHALEAAMVLDLFGLIGAYAAGSCRDVSTSVYVMALAGAVLVYVVIHVIFFTLDDENKEVLPEKIDEDGKKALEKKRKRLLLFAIMAATVTYQAGMTPPGGFVESGEHAGDPVLLHNFPRRYNAFFYSNSVSFMMSAAVIVLLVNPNLYRPAIRSNALSVCTAAGPVGLIGAYAAGSTQYMETSVRIVILVAVIIFFVLLLLRVTRLVMELIFKNKQDNGTAATNDHQPSSGQQAGDIADAKKHEIAASKNGTPASPKGTAEANDAQSSSEQQAKKHVDVEIAVSKNGTPPSPKGTAGANDDDKDKAKAKGKYLMLVGILVASVTYQAGLDPPGGFWESDDGEHGHGAGYPVMHDNRSGRYHVFFYSNSTSFEASIVVIVLLLLPLDKWKWWLTVMNLTVVLDLLSLLLAYAAGSCRDTRTSLYVVALVAAGLAYVAVHVMISYSCDGQPAIHNEPPSIQQPAAQPSEQQQPQADDQVIYIQS